MIQSGTKVTGKVTVKPTTAYVGDNTEGKLTLYVPYYGVTGIGQITLSASGSGNVQLHAGQMPMQILTKSATETTASVTFELEGEDAPPSSSLPIIFDHNYTIGTRSTENNLSYDTSGNGFSTTPSEADWMEVGNLTSNTNGNKTTYTQQIDMTINTDEESRSGAVIVFSPSGREVTRFIIEQAAAEEPETPGVIPAEIPITNLAYYGNSEKPSNCYIITEPGRYMIPTYLGSLTNGPGANDKPQKGKVYVNANNKPYVWSDNNNTISFVNGHISDNKLIFDVNVTYDANNTPTTTTLSAGNTLIAITDDNGDILWSWHLWFCNSEPNVQKYDETNYLMDRYLGAAASATEGISIVSKYIDLYWKDGLFYQSGRKDPFKVYETTANNVTTYSYEHTAMTGASVANSIQHPTHFYTDWSSESGWAATKGQHDPCPPGYKVPVSDVWSKPSDKFTRIINANDWLFIYEFLQLDAIVYPYSGHIDTNGDYVTGNAGTGREPRTYKNRINVIGSATEILVPSNQPTSSLTPLYSNPTTTYAKPKKFDNVKYELVDELRTANVLAAGNQEKSMGYKEKGVKITQYTVTEGVWNASGKGTLFNPYKWVANYKGATSRTVIGDSELTPKEKEEILDNIQNSDVTIDNIANNWQDLIKDLFNGYQNQVVYSESANTTSKACVIRCVAEIPPTGN